MSKVKIYLTLALSFLIVSGRALAQNSPPPPPPEPLDAVKLIYEFLLNAPAEQYDFLGQYLCGDYNYTRQQWDIRAAARGDAVFSLEGVTFTLEELDDEAGKALVSLEGTPLASSSSGQIPVAVLPSQVELLIEGASGWRVCPTDNLVTIISPADLALPEEAAFEAAVQFYAAFYTFQSETLAALACSAKQEALLQSSANNFSQGFEVLPSEWGLGLVPQGYTVDIETAGTLELLSFAKNAPVVADDRRDFLNAHMVRENGWKFCGDYRPGETAIADFARAYFGAPDDPEQVKRLTCRAYREIIGEAALAWAIPVEIVNIPDGLFVDDDVADGESEAQNLAGLVVIGSDGSYASAGTEFGSTAQLVREGNHWKWCQLPLALAEEAD